MNVSLRLASLLPCAVLLGSGCIIVDDTDDDDAATAADNAEDHSATPPGTDPDTDGGDDDNNDEDDDDDKSLAEPSSLVAARWRPAPTRGDPAAPRAAWRPDAGPRSSPLRPRPSRL